MALAAQKLVSPTTSGLTFQSVSKSTCTSSATPMLISKSSNLSAICNQLSSLRVMSSTRSLSAPLISKRQSLKALSPVAQAVAGAEVEEVKTAKAVLKGIRMSSTKVRRVVNQVRGRSYEDILMILQFMPYRACEPVYNLVLSCAANAENNLGLTKSELYVSEALVDAGPTLKRFQPRAQGRGFPIRKRTCRVTITMREAAK